jgi:Zn ribbon nucleic-acid-binding protein
VVAMAECPSCKKKISKPDKTWKYGQSTVRAFSCNNCGMGFREYYSKAGKHIFTLKLNKGKGFVKA